MNVIEIPDQTLERMAKGNAIPSDYVDIAALARAELERRKLPAALVVPPKVKLECYGDKNCPYAASDLGTWVCTNEEPCQYREPPKPEPKDGIITESTRDIGASMMGRKVWPITAAAYEAAKAKASGKPSPCLDCGNVHEGGCVNTNEKVDTPDTPKRIEPLVNRDKYTSRQAVNLYWAKLNELIEAVNEMRKDGAK